MSAPYFVDQVLRRDDVAERLRHLPPLAVDDEAVGDDAPVGRLAEERHGGQQRRLEPAAVLVVPLDVEVGRRPAAARASAPATRPSAARRGARRPSRTRRPGCRSRSRNPPGEAAQVGARRQEVLRRPRVPGVAALRAEDRGDVVEELLSAPRASRPGIDPGALAVLHRVEERDRRAPAPLPGDRPTRAGSRPCRRCAARPRPAPSARGGSRRARRPGRRSPGSSSRTNHWTVARKMTGFLQRQQCGYSCRKFGSRWRSAPAARRSSTISGLASRTFLPRYFATVVKRPASSTGERIGRFSRRPVRKSSSPCARRGVHEARCPRPS